jgi:PAS domain S-box-containing protein
MLTANGSHASTLRDRANGGTSSALAQLRPVLELASLVRGERELDDALDSIAATIASGLGWKTVVINLYRPAWDDFQVTTVHGNEDARSALLGTTSEWKDWEPLLDERFERGGAYIVRSHDLDWTKLDLATFIPEGPASTDPELWGPEDSLIVPLAYGQRRLLGILSIDEPLAGRPPTDEELELLGAMAAQAAHAVEQQQRFAETGRHRAALEHLHQVSAQLSAVGPREQVLDAVAKGIAQALGFEKVSVLLREGDGFVNAASCGWSPEEPGFNVTLTAKDLEALLDPLFESEGCYLLPCESALERCSSGSDYESSKNGRGPWAWNRHWLLTPLRNEAGEVIGHIWSDDPTDRLLPSREKLRVLRMFANQAATALELARTFAAEHEATELLRAMIASSPLATIRIDRDGVVRAWNAAAEELYGWRADDVLGRPYPRETVAQQLEFAHILAPVLEGESFRGLEVVRETRDGRQVDVSISAAPLYDAGGGTVVGAVYVHEDIRGRKRAARELAESQELYRRVVETLSDVISLLDLDGNVVFTSLAVEDLLGYTPDELVSRNIDTLLHPDDLAGAKASIAETIATGNSALTHVRARHRDGRWVSLEVKGTAVLDQSGEPQQVLGILRERD